MLTTWTHVYSNSFCLLEESSKCILTFYEYFPFVSLCVSGKLHIQKKRSVTKAIIIPTIFIQQLLDLFLFLFLFFLTFV